MSVGVMGYGVYVPRFRMKREDIGKAWSTRGRGENSVADYDEDIITMAAEASLNALYYSRLRDGSALGCLYLGTDSSTHIEHSSLGVIAEVLRAREELDIADFTASPRSSFAALKACMDGVASGRIPCGLAVASESRCVSPGSSEEMNCGDGAAAFILGMENTIADIEGVFTYTSYVADRWRSTATPYLQEYEPRFTRDYGYHRHLVEAVRGLLKKTSGSISDFQHIVLQQPDPRMARGAAKALKIDPQQTQAGDLFHAMGDVGAASVFLGMAAVLDKAEPGDRILAVSYGSGTSDAAALRVNDRICEGRGKGRSLESYLRSKTYISDYVAFARLKGALAKSTGVTKIGLPPASSALWRDGRHIRQLRGAKCRKCGYVNYPPSIRKICIRCGQTEFDEVFLSRRGKVHTFCISLYVPPPLVGPMPIIVADLDDGNRYRALGTEIKGQEEIRIDMPVELVLRNILAEDGLKIYGNAFRPPRGD
jgi:hydroxymethylglutaryl-CoA synthase